MEPLSVLWKAVSSVISLFAKTGTYESYLSKPVETLSRLCWGPRLQMRPEGPYEAGGKDKYYLVQVKVLNQARHWYVPNLNPLQRGIALVTFFDDEWKPYGKPMLARTQWTINRGQMGVINIAALSKSGQCCGYGMGVIYEHGWLKTMLPVSPDNPNAVTIRFPNPWEFFPGKKYFVKVTVGNDKIICAESFFVLTTDGSVSNFRLEAIERPPRVLWRERVC